MPDKTNKSSVSRGSSCHKGKIRSSSKNLSYTERTKASPARLAALDVLRTVRERAAFAQEIITARIDKSDLIAEDRAFATRLILGVVSSVGTLDEVINRALNKPSDIKDDVRDALRLSTYEIVFLKKEPHVAVNQGVELVRSFQPKAMRLANAVLHRIVLLRTKFPFGDPKTDIEALARSQAFPAWVAHKLVSEIGFDAAADFMHASNQPAPLFISVNAVKTTDESVEKVFKRCGEQATTVRIDKKTVSGCLSLSDRRALLIPEIKALISTGKILVSDASSQMVAASVLPKNKPMSFLEIGAGRATKTILLQSAAQRMWGSQIDEYVTLDNHAFKTKILRDRTANYGIRVSEALTGNAGKLDALMPGRQFDAVFIDAPCSGIGTLRRHPEIRWRLKPEDLGQFASVQLALLRNAASHVVPGGTLAYATCTVTSEENQSVVLAFLKSAEGQSFCLSPIAERSHLAVRLKDGSPDAHFAVRFVRVS